jgi:hypothetical protein
MTAPVGVAVAVTVTVTAAVAVGTGVGQPTGDDGAVVAGERPIQ